MWATMKAAARSCPAGYVPRNICAGCTLLESLPEELLLGGLKNSKKAADENILVGCFFVPYILKFQATISLCRVTPVWGLSSSVNSSDLITAWNVAKRVSLFLESIR